MKKNKRLRSRFKIQRKLGVELPGLGKPGALERKPYPPGQHGNKRKKYSDYSIQLEEKQKILFNYWLREEQLRRFIRQSKSGTETNWVNTLIGRLECRLDNVLFRMGFAPSILAARQIISHGHVKVNDQKVSIGSQVLKVGDTVELTEKMYQGQTFLQAQQNPRLEPVDWLEVIEKEKGKKMGTVKQVPGLEAVPFPFSSGVFAEYYAQRSV